MWPAERGAVRRTPVPLPRSSPWRSGESSAGVDSSSSSSCSTRTAARGANTSVGARLAFKPSPNAVLRVAVLDGVPVDRVRGVARVFAPGDGALLAGELAILERPDSGVAERNPRFRVGRGVTRPYT